MVKKQRSKIFLQNFSSSFLQPYPNQVDQTYWIYQHLLKIPIDYIRSYIASIGIKQN
jgi:hypothetical protein